MLMNDFFKGTICLASDKLYVKMKFHQVVNINIKILLITSLYNAYSYDVWDLPCQDAKIYT